jgi:hypothetical protein
MYTLVRLLSVKRLTYEQLPAIGLAWLIAELFERHDRGRSFYHLPRRHTHNG